MKLRYKRKHVPKTKYSFEVSTWIKETKLYLEDAPLQDPKDFIYKGRTIFSLNRFINGQCLNFAMACEKIFGLKAFVYMTETRVDYEGIGHCFCLVTKKDGDIYVLDAKGIRKLESAVSEFVDFKQDRIYRLNKEFLKEWIYFFSTKRSKVRKQMTINQRLNKIASLYIGSLFGDVKIKLRNGI